mmetsp:Transcript_111262/g.321715  ORF Transcript_111262/g.321715 Transcript_111262/m.321715 type:complete len:221 (-) Transcript_111262:174-836(-)
MDSLPAEMAFSLPSTSVVLRCGARAPDFAAPMAPRTNGTCVAPTSRTATMATVPTAKRSERGVDGTRERKRSRRRIKSTRGMESEAAKAAMTRAKRRSSTWRRRRRRRVCQRRPTAPAMPTVTCPWQMARMTGMTMTLATERTGEEEGRRRRRARSTKGTGSTSADAGARRFRLTTLRPCSNLQQGTLRTTRPLKRSSSAPMASLDRWRSPCLRTRSAAP